MLFRSGVAVLCIDDANVRDIIPFVSQPVLRYGLSEDADIRASNVRADGTQMHFTVERRTVRRHGNKPGPLNITLNLPGLHNVRNALAAIGIATELGVGDEAITKALSEFSGVGRRFQRYGEISLASGGSFTLIDDYGHHPTEISVTLTTAKNYAGSGDVIVVFQPHRYSRTAAFVKEFANALSIADRIYLLEIYSAGESPIPGVSSKLIADLLPNAIYNPSMIEVVEEVAKISKRGDLIITLGAGDVSALAPVILETLNAN